MYSLVINSYITVKTKATYDLPVHNINTGLDYATIQAAINAYQTKDGHTIKVDAGIFNETLVISKSISLVGENPLNTIINGRITISGPQVSISNFTLNGGVITEAEATYCKIYGNVTVGKDYECIGVEGRSDHGIIQGN